MSHRRPFCAVAKFYILFKALNCVGFPACFNKNNIHVLFEAINLRRGLLLMETTHSI